MRRPLDTDLAKLTRTVNRELFEQCDEIAPDHKIFRAMGGRHFRVELYGSDKTALISVRRLAYALQHPEDHVGPDEEVWTTCEHHGNHQTGEGTCLVHLRKVSGRQEVALVRAHGILSEQLAEAQQR